MKQVSASLALAFALLLPETTGGAESRVGPDPLRVYEVRYQARIVPTERAARVSVSIGSGARYVRGLQFRTDPERHLDFEGDGEIETTEEGVDWTPPRGGGTLRYVFRIDALRDELSFDARSAEDWALFRGDDLVPPARARTVRGAMSEATLRLRLPAGWSAATPFRRTGNHTYRIDTPFRRFDRPVGWMVVGDLGVLRERVAGVRVAVAGPIGHGLRRLDILALLRWNLRTMRKIVDLPDRLLIVGAGDPMWRGGLSGPNSVFIHADRPLITEDGTSPLLHELIHTVMRQRAGPGDDWIAEGLAELYSLELMVRSRTISRRRYEKALDRLVKRGRNADGLRSDRSSGAVTARAVGVLRALDREIRARSEDEKSLDDVLRILTSGADPLTTEGLRAAAEEVAGVDLGSFFRSHVPDRRR